MNFKKLQEMQAKLDEAILQAKPEMTEEERFTKTLVALSVELAEVANCAEHFKFWKDNKGKVDRDRFISVLDFRFVDEVRNDNRKYVLLKNTDDLLVDSTKKYTLDNFELLTHEQAHHLTLVEECSDCLHFILSLANQIGYEIEMIGIHFNDEEDDDSSKEENLLFLNYLIGSSDKSESTLEMLLDVFFIYVRQLDVTTEELEQAYYEKNKVNYERLESGY